MKLAFVIFRYFPFGGLQRDMLALAQYFTQCGHQITVYCERWQGEKIAGIPVVEIPSGSGINIAGVKKFVDQFAQVFPRADFDLVIGFNKMPGLDVYFAGDTCFAFKALCERNWLYRLAPRTRLYLNYEAAVFGEQSHTQILSLVNTEQKQFARFYATAPERVHALPPGILPAHIACASPGTARSALRNELGLAPATQIILCLGSGFYTKGVDISIAVFARLQALCSNTVLLVVGNDEPEKFRAQARALGVAETVYFLGPRTPVGDLLHAVDLLLHPARKELAGNVILEAMLSACPVVASDHCGYAHYIVKHQMGELITSAATPASIAQQLQKLLAIDKNHWCNLAEQLPARDDFYARSPTALAAIETIARQKQTGASLRERRTESTDEVVVLRDELLVGWRDAPVFELAQQLTGQVAREMSDRQTLRFELDGQGFYRKWHRGVGWGEIVKNLLRLRLPVLGARNEWDALNKMRALGIPGLIPVAFGERGRNPARRQSFIVTRELQDVIQLDHFFEQRQVQPVIKRALINKVATIARDLHAAGINHRDFYLCHFMLRESTLSMNVQEMTLVDLHRAQWRAHVPERWVVKDIGSLLFSSFNLGFSRRDYYRFLKIYFGKDLRSLLVERELLLTKIVQRARRTYRRDFGHLPGF